MLPGCNTSCTYLSRHFHQCMMMKPSQVSFLHHPLLLFGSHLWRPLQFVDQQTRLKSLKMKTSSKIHTGYLTYIPSSFCLAPLYRNDTGLFPLDFFLGRPITVLSAPLGLQLFRILLGNLILCNSVDAIRL